MNLATGQRQHVASESLIDSESTHCRQTIYPQTDFSTCWCPEVREPLIGFSGFAVSQQCMRCSGVLDVALSKREHACTPTSATGFHASGCMWAGRSKERCASCHFGCDVYSGDSLRRHP